MYPNSGFISQLRLFQCELPGVDEKQPVKEAMGKPFPPRFGRLDVSSDQAEKEEEANEDGMDEGLPQIGEDGEEVK